MDYDLAFGSQGGLDVTVTVTLADGVAKGRGLAFGGDFPVIYEKDGTFLRFKLDALALYFGNMWCRRRRPWATCRYAHFTGDDATAAVEPAFFWSQKLRRLWLLQRPRPVSTKPVWRRWSSVSMERSSRGVRITCP